MAASAEQVELLVTADTGHNANSTATSHAAMYHGHNLTDFDVKYGRKEPDTDDTSCCDSVLSSVRNVSCKQVLNFIERHVPAVNLIRTYKVCDRLTVNLYTVLVFIIIMFVY